MVVTCVSFSTCSHLLESFSGSVQQVQLKPVFPGQAPKTTRLRLVIRSIAVLFGEFGSKIDGAAFTLVPVWCHKGHVGL